MIDFSSKNPFISKAIYALVPIGVIGLVFWLVMKNWEMILNFPWHIHIPSLLMAATLHSMALLVTYWVWHLMIERLSGFNNRWANLRIYYISTLAKRIPTSIPYISGRLVLYRQVGVSSAAVLNSVLLENLLIGIAGVFVLIIFWHLYTGNTPLYVTFFLGIIALVLLAYMMLRFDTIRQYGNKLLKRLNLSELDQSPTSKDFTLWIGLYSLPWFFAGGSLYFAIQGVTESVPITMGNALVISTLASLVSLLNLIIPGGLGLKEVSMTALLLPWMPASVAILFSLSYRLLHTVDEILWAVAALCIPNTTGVLPVKDASNHLAQDE